MMTWQDKHKFDAEEAEEAKRLEEEEKRIAALKAAVASGGALEDLEEEDTQSLGVVSQM